MISDEEFKKLEKSESDLEKDKQECKAKLIEAYHNILDVLKEYLDLKEEFYNIIALWIIGTYFHDKFPSYPFLYLNAMKGSGKTRTLNLITAFAKDGEILNSLTEAVLFRTKGTLAIDEFEGVSRKGTENLKELLNSAYKKGSKVKRMKQQKTAKGIQQVVEEFEVYRPIVLANIWGMPDVLGDRCISLILEKSNKKVVTNLVEIFQDDKIVQETRKILEQCRLCRFSFSAETYRDWNNFVKYNNTNNINNIHNTNYTNNTKAFKTIYQMNLNGREVELSLPLLLIAYEISSENNTNSTIFQETTLSLKSLFEQKKEEEISLNYDISLYDFVSQMPKKEWIVVGKILQDFKEFLQSNEEWINAKWLGRALKRLNLFSDTKRLSSGRYYILDIEKAKQKIKMFR